MAHNVTYSGFTLFINLNSGQATILERNFGITHYAIEVDLLRRERIHLSTIIYKGRPNWKREDETNLSTQVSQGRAWLQCLSSSYTCDFGCSQKLHTKELVRHHKFFLFIKIYFSLHIPTLVLPPFPSSYSPSLPILPPPTSQIGEVLPWGKSGIPR